MKRILTAIAVALLLAGCAGPASSSDEDEYSETDVLWLSRKVAGVECLLDLRQMSDDDQLVEDACFEAMMLIEVRDGRYFVPILLEDTGLRAPEDVKRSLEHDAHRTLEDLHR